MQMFPYALDPDSFTALGPSPEHMSGCSGCYDYGTTAGRVNAIVIDPTTTTNGSITAYLATVGGGVAKTTTCCTSTTSWSLITDDPLISTTSIDTLALDPQNHNTIYAGTGDLNFGSFSMGSQGILKSTDGGATWSVLGSSVFGAAYVEPPNQFPQYDAVGKVRVDPNNSSRVVAGTKKGIFMSYDGGVNWNGPCRANSFADQRQDTTGLELTDLGGGVTRILVAVGTRGFATPVQYDLGLQGANGLYKGTMPASGCPGDFTLLTRNDNGFVFGTSVTGSPYATGASLNAGTGVPYSNISTGNQLSRMDIAVAPSNPNYIYVQVGSIAANNNSGCGNGSGCQLGVWVSTDGGGTWSYMAGSAGGSLRACSNGGTAVADRPEPEAAITRRTGTTRVSRSTRIIPTGYLSIHLTPGLRHARAPRFTTSPADTAARPLRPMWCTLTITHLHSCPAPPASFWKAAMAACSLPRMPTLPPRRRFGRAGSIWTPD